MSATMPAIARPRARPSCSASTIALSVSTTPLRNAIRNGAGLHDIRGMSSTTAMAALSLGVVVLFAVGLTVAALRAFRRTAVR
jgi:hypothetical protein